MSDTGNGSTAYDIVKKYTEEKVERKNGSIVLKNNDNEELKRWNFFRALPCRWIGPKLDAKDRSSFAVERIEIAHEGIEVDNDSLSIQNNTPWFHIGQNMSEETNFIGADEDSASIGAIEEPQPIANVTEETAVIKDEQ